jgi:CubicO group peptidase (beta-lactamase class C family)
MERHNLPGLALVVTRGGEVIHLAGYGVSEVGIPITPQTQFFLASVSKSFTALAVLQLVEEGKIGLDTPVQRYLPDFTLKDSAGASQITVRHLLNHTSGLADRGFPELRVPQARTPAERLASLRSARLVSQPGQVYAYFNPNYEILARLVEVVSRQDFSAYLEEHLFTPLGMANTFSVSYSAEAEVGAVNLAQGHILAYGFPLALDEMHGYIGGSGGIVATVEDMGNFLIMQNGQGLFGGSALVSPETLALTHTPPPGIPSDYGMGWILRQNGSRRILEHNGVFSVYYAEIVLMPDDDLGFALLYNANGLTPMAFAYPQIKNGLLDLLTGQTPKAGGFSVVHWGAIMGLLTASTTVLSMRSLLRRKPVSRGDKSPWRLLLGSIWNLIPAVCLAAMPALASTGSGRVFGYTALSRSMPEVFVWLGTAAIFGIIQLYRRITAYFKTT